MNLNTIDYLHAETGGEFLEVDDSVVVLIELNKEVNAVVLEGWVGGSLALDLVKDVLDVLLGEHVGVVFHVFLGVLIGGDELEAESSKEDGSANKEVLLLVVGV